jgi:membrane protease YdiL (CAAX protease family)
VLSLARRTDLTDAEIGIATGQLRRGLAIGGGIAVILLVLIIGGAALADRASLNLPVEFAACNAPRSAREVLFKSLIRVPLGTAIAEELFFRGVLFGMWAKARGFIQALFWCSLAFALWHVGPTIANQCPGAPTLVVSIGRDVAVTMALGAALVLLRRVTRGIVAPIIVHAALNSSLVVGGYIALR